MPETQPTSSGWIRGIAVALLLTGTLLFFYRYFSPKPDWETIRTSAVEQYNLGNLDEAERLLVSALKVAGYFSEKDARLHQSLRDLIEFYTLQSKFSEAEPVILRLIALDEKLLGPDHPNVAASLNNLAENYRVRGEVEKANTAYQKSLAIMEKKFGTEHELVAHIKEGYHRFLREAGKPLPGAPPPGADSTPGTGNTP
ncbi:MAG: tetratricopeptide repeat protein [Nitrospina sp.]|nr:tetratricopeptide repeat protein [Nitrospina sp.]